MKRFIGVVLVVVVAMVTTQFVGTTEADAQTGDWEQIGWLSGDVATTFPVTGPASVDVIDLQCIGDNYEIQVDGTVVLTTPPVALDCAVNVFFNPDQAFATPGLSGGTISVPAGSHTVTIRHVSGFTTGWVAWRINPVAANTGGIAHIPVCIESDMAQAQAQGMRAGDHITSDGQFSYVLVTGDDYRCEYNCLMGFDLNCDGKVGDFCPVELDRTAVSNVAPCLEASRHVVGSAATTAVVTPISAPAETTLAHTGTETTLSNVGLGLVAAGAAMTALGIRRRRHA